MSTHLKYCLPILVVVLLSCERLRVEDISNSLENAFSLVNNNSISTDENEGYDQPANEGVRNVLLNAALLTDLKYETTAPLNANRVYGPGEAIKGIVYSSTRYEDLFCPNNVSLWTYLSSLSDPRSYMYSIDISSPPYSIMGLAKSYYGQVCSSFVQYALGIKYNLQIHQMTVWDDLVFLNSQVVDSLSLGDVLTSKQKVHTRLITGIRRDNGSIVSISISEGVSPVAVETTTYSPNDVKQMLEEDGYSIYRYRYIDQVQFPSNSYNCSDLDSFYFNTAIMPKRGDRANWRKDEEVIIDILNAKSYFGFQVTKDGSHFRYGSLETDKTEINLGVLPAGEYEMTLIGYNKESTPVSWIVVDYNIEAEPIGNGVVRVYFTSTNSTPIWLTWRRPANSNSANNNMPVWTTVIKESDRTQGYTLTQLDSYTEKKYGLGQWDFKVAFETKYGIISSDSVSINVQ